MKFFNICVLAFFFLLPTIVFSKESGFKGALLLRSEISADSIEYNRDKNTFTARGK